MHLQSAGFSLPRVVKLKLTRDFTKATTYFSFLSSALCLSPTQNKSFRAFFFPFFAGWNGSEKLINFVALNLEWKGKFLTWHFVWERVNVYVKPASDVIMIIVLIHS